MKYLFKSIFQLFLFVLFVGCHPSGVGGADGQYYVHSALVRGINGDHDLRLRITSATLACQSEGGTADLSFSFQAEHRNSINVYSVDAFKLSLSQVPVKAVGYSTTFNAQDIMGTISYTVSNKEKSKNGSITRNVSVSGELNSSNPSSSSLSFTSEIFEAQPLTLTLSQITAEETDQSFPPLGELVITDYIHKKVIFRNHSGHGVTVQYVLTASPSSEAFVPDHEEKNIPMFGDEDPAEARYILTFDDGKVSRHYKQGDRFDYEGLVPTVVENPFLNLQSGTLGYDINYEITYTITPEIYAAATLPE